MRNVLVLGAVGSALTLGIVSVDAAATESTYGLVHEVQSGGGSGGSGSGGSGGSGASGAKGGSNKSTTPGSREGGGSPGAGPEKGAGAAKGFGPNKADRDKKMPAGEKATPK